MQIVVGSTALQFHGFDRLPPKDIDIWSTDKRDTENSVDLKVIPSDILDLVDHTNGYATPDSVYTIKCSHLGWDNPMWDKHKKDIMWLKSKGCLINKPLFDKLITYWKIELGNKSFLKMKQDKENFFTDNVYYKYDHDYLHELVAYPNRPVYTKCLCDGEDVLISEDKFNTLSFEEQLRMFREEITVIACERWLLNDKLTKKFSWVQAYNMSLKKTITNLTKNWATTFLVLNLDKFVKPEYEYFEHILNTLEEED